MSIGGRVTGTGSLQVFPPSVDLATPTSRLKLKASSASVEEYMFPARWLVSHGSPRFTNSGAFGSAPPSVKLAPPSVEYEKPLMLLPAVRKSPVRWPSLEPAAN